MINDFGNFIIILVCSLGAGFLGHYLPKRYMDKYRDRLYSADFPEGEVEKEIGKKIHHEKTKDITRKLGILERIIYAGGWLAGFPEIIGIVLALKIAPSLKEHTGNKLIGWAIFNMYVIGNFLSLLSAIIIAQFLKFGIDWLLVLFQSFKFC